MTVTSIVFTNGERFDVAGDSDPKQVWKAIKSHEGVAVTGTRGGKAEIFPNPGQVAYVSVGAPSDRL